MRRSFLVFCAGLSLTACASTAIKPEPLAASIRPVEQQSGSHLDTALTIVKAQADFNAERYDESYNGFQIAALKEPENLPARIGWGNAAIALNLFEKAYEIFSNKLGLEAAKTPEKHAHLAGLVLAEVATGRAIDEEVRLNEALEYNLHDVRLWNALGRFHDKQEDWVPAQRTYLKALNAGPKARSSVINNLGMSFLKQGQYNMALEKFEHALDLKPQHNLYDNNRRLTLALMNDYTAATDSLAEERAAGIFNDAGYIALSQKKYDIAKDLITQAIDLSPFFNLTAETNLITLKAELNAIKIDEKITRLAKTELTDFGTYIAKP